MRINRRTLIAAISAVAAVASLGLNAPARAADGKEIAYLTPGLDLPFWRYLSKIPVVVADIGTNSGEYVSFIISDNYQGAYGVGEALAAAMKEKAGRAARSGSSPSRRRARTGRRAPQASAP